MICLYFFDKVYHIRLESILLPPARMIKQNHSVNLYNIYIEFNVNLKCSR